MASGEFSFNILLIFKFVTAPWGAQFYCRVNTEKFFKSAQTWLIIRQIVSISGRGEMYLLCYNVSFFSKNDTL